MKTIMKNLIIFLIVTGMLWGITSRRSEAATPARATKSTTVSKTVKAIGNDPGKGFRKKDISFEERVIEGMSGRNYESLSQTGTAEGAVGDRLYRKRANFDEESKTLLREMEYLK